MATTKKRATKAPKRKNATANKATAKPKRKSHTKVGEGKKISLILAKDGFRLPHGYKVVKIAKKATKKKAVKKTAK